MILKKNVIESIDEQVLIILQHLQKKIAEENRVPEHITYIDLIKTINDTLNRLYKSKVIETGRTINDRWIKINIKI